MPWRDFIGNAGAVRQVRELIASGRANRTLVLGGPAGIGKTTLALMAGLALNCQAPPEPGEFCGACVSCVRFCGWDQLDALAEAALEHREQEVKTRPKEVAPLVLAPHPAVRLYPPDGDFVTLGQARALIHQSELRPDAGRRWCLVAPDLDNARWMVQSALLKTLEEPPERVTVVALARNPGVLLPTVRSRALVLSLQPVATEELEAALGARGMGVEAAAWAARWSQGAPGRALTLDAEAWRQARADALEWLEAAATGPRAAPLFRFTETLRAGKEKFETLSEILYSVLQDIQYLQSGFPEAVRNQDCLHELERWSQRLAPQQLGEAVSGLDRIQSAIRRNANRGLALEAWAWGLGRPRMEWERQGNVHASE